MASETMAPAQPPMPDGNQYIAVMAGVGGWAGAVVAGNMDTRDATGASGFANAMRDLQAATKAGSKLFVFALPGAGAR